MPSTTNVNGGFQLIRSDTDSIGFYICIKRLLRVI